MKEEWKYRKKGERIVIECNRQYKAILPRDAKELYDILTSVCHDKKELIASQKDGKNKENENKKFSQSLLNESQKDDANPYIPSMEQLKKVLEADK